MEVVSMDTRSAGLLALGLTLSILAVVFSLWLYLTISKDGDRITKDGSMTFLQALKAYQNPDGTVSNKTPAVKTDNNYAFTSTAFMVEESLLKYASNDEDFVKLLYHFDKYIDGRWLEPGLYDVDTSWSERTISHDDINGLAAYDERIATELYHYGMEHNWTYINRPRSEIYSEAIAGDNNIRIPAPWYKRPYLLLKEYAKQNIYRMGYLVPYIKVRAGHKPSWLEQQWYAWDIRQAAKKPWGDTSTKLLYLRQSEHRDTFPPIMREAMEEFLRAMNDMYGDFSGIYSIYFGKDHPFSTYTKGVKFI
jgi:hypothetical protein